VGEALRTLEKTFLLSLIYPTITATLPLIPDLKKSPRLQILDTGMMNYFSGVQVNLLKTSDLSKVYQGTIIEHLSGQELLASRFNALSNLNFWVREKSTSTAEVNYVIPYEGKLIPIEIKSAKDGALKSLHLFMNQAPHEMAIRFYAGPVTISEIETETNKKYFLLSLPYYLVTQLDNYLPWFEQEIKKRNY
jgi:predicted AAA+ superfamily ATPase